jgi:secretion/DNA translocation related TadE-like protein
MVALAGMLAAVGMAAVLVGAAVVGRHRAGAAADLAALAGAGRAVLGDPQACAVAAGVAAANGAAVDSCSVGAGAVVEVRVRVPVRLGPLGVLDAPGRARAGPAPPVAGGPPGELSPRLPGEAVELGAGDAVTMPRRHTAHLAQALSDEDGTGAVGPGSRAVTGRRPPPPALEALVSKSAPGRVGRIVDLSHPLDDGTPVYPGDPVARFTPAATVAADGYNLLHVRMGSQTGTHVDAPYHFLEDGARIDELPLDVFLGPAVIADLRGLGPREGIAWRHLAPYADRLGRGRMLVLHTGWDEHWGTDAYVDHPFLTEDAAVRVVAAGVRTVALDAASPDETVVGDATPHDFPAHRAVLGAGGVIVENLCNLGAVGAVDPVFSVLPLRFTGADGAPVRAVAFELDG